MACIALPCSPISQQLLSELLVSMCGRHDLHSNPTELGCSSTPVPSSSVPGLTPGPQAQSSAWLFQRMVSEDTVLSLTLTLAAWLGKSDLQGSVYPELSSLKCLLKSAYRVREPSWRLGL